MISYIKMKKKEFELKLLIYSYLLPLFKEKESIISATTTLLRELSNTPEEELKNIFIEKIVSIAHEQENKEN